MHWCYNFQTTKDIEIIFGDLLIWYISSSGKMFKHVAFMYYKFMDLSTCHPGHLGALQKTLGLNDTSCCYGLYFLNFGNNKIRKKVSDVRLTCVKTV